MPKPPDKLRRASRADQSSAVPQGNAAAVVARVKSIAQIIQARGSFNRFPIAPEEVEGGFAKPTARARSLPSNKLLVQVDMAYEATAKRSGDGPRADGQVPESNPDRDLVMKVEATFIVIYELSEGAPSTDGDLQSFAQANGVFNVTPFWREYLSNCFARAGMPPVVVPTMKLPQSKVEQHQTTARLSEA